MATIPVEELSQSVRFGLYPCRDGDDGETRKTVMKVDVSIRTNDSKEQVLIAVNVAHEKMVEFVETNYDAFVVPFGDLP